MALNRSLRNRIVGFTIVASTILIFLPVILSKDMIRHERDDAIAIDQNGPVYNDDGSLHYQSLPDGNKSLNLHDDEKVTSLPLSGPNANQSYADSNSSQGSGSMQVTGSSNNVQIAGNNSGSASNLTVNTRLPDRSVETIDLSKNNSSSASKDEVLVAKRPVVKPVELGAVSKPAPAPAKPAPKPAPKEEVLIAKKPAKPAASAPAPSSSASGGDNVIAGSKPKGFSIQVGVFSKRANVDALISKIKSQGISVYAISYTDNNGRELFRVYAGQSASRDGLNNTLVKLNSLLGTNGKIVTM